MKMFLKMSFIVLLIGFSLNLNAQNNPTIEVEKLGDNLYRFALTTNFSVNMVVFDGPDGILLVDTGMPGISEQVLTEIRKISDKDINYIINTHHHPDHYSGNPLMGKGAVKIAHRNVLTALTSGFNVIQEYGPDVLPQITFEKEMDIYFNGETIKLTALPGTHSNSDIIVHFPKTNVVVVSSLLTNQAFPFIGANDGGSVLNYESVLNFLVSNFNEETKFVIGHGENCKYTDLKDFQSMVSKTLDIVKTQLTNGKTVEQIQEENLLKDWESWSQGFVTTNAWVQTIDRGINPPQTTNAKESIALALFYIMKEKGIDTAIKDYDQLKEEKADDYDFREFNLNLLGYALLGKNKFDEAIKIFKLNIKAFPESANVYDSLGEAYERSGNTEMALKNYKKAVANAEKNKDANLDLFKRNMERLQN